MELISIAAFTDNYIWMLHDGVDAIVVDPGDAAPVIAALKAHSLRLAAILVTHHHGDHVGGIDDLRHLLVGKVYGPAREQIPQPCVPVHAGESLTLLGLRFSVIDVPGHTSGHIAFFLADCNDGKAPILFCGDTMFSAGCGRLFEGTAAQMHTSLQRLAKLPGNTRVCCAHEYTLSNLRFAQAIAPAGPALIRYIAWCEAQRAQGLPTLPSTLATELQVNPFLRCTEPDIVAAAVAHAAALNPTEPLAADSDPVAVFATLRQWKNDFR
jgi:hydroxyacylglutathione hydrolase